MPLFNPDWIPEDTVSPAGVEDANAVMEVLRGLRVSEVVMQEFETRFRVSNMVRVYCQAHLWRCVELAETGETLVRSGRGLSAMMVARAIYESVAAFLHFEATLAKVVVPLETLDDVRRVEDFVAAKTFATRLPNLIAAAGTEDVKATSILTQIEKLQAVYKDAVSDYEHLCEYTHPNVFGSFLWFGERHPDTDTVTFSQNGQVPNDPLFWTVTSVRLLAYFVVAYLRIEALLDFLSDAGRRLAPSQPPPAGIDSPPA